MVSEDHMLDWHPCQIYYTLNKVVIIIIVIIIIIGVQKISASSLVVKILFPDVSMARRPSFSMVMRF